ncbi:hypothetical protein D3C86_1820560 [compost metagenome]
MEDLTLYKRVYQVETDTGNIALILRNEVDRIDKLEKEVHNLTQELESALKEIRELKHRVMEDDLK